MFHREVRVLKLATLCYVQRPGQTLMLHRVKKAHDMHAGKWNGLGGKLHPGETPEECAIREVYEESGLRCRNPEWRGFLTFPAFDGFEDWYVWLFRIREWEGELIDSPEGRLAWIDNEHLFELPLWEGDRVFLRWLLQDERFFSAKFMYQEGRFLRYEAVFYGPGGQVAREARGRDELPFLAGPSGQEGQGGRDEDGRCWICGARTIQRHCRIVCPACGFTRDCSDP